MSKRNFVLGASAVVLAVVSGFAGRASNKFSQATKLYISNDKGVACQQLVLASIPGFTSGIGTDQAAVRTAGGSNRLIYSTSGCGTSHKVYFKP